MACSLLRRSVAFTFCHLLQALTRNELHFVQYVHLGLCKLTPISVSVASTTLMKSSSVSLPPEW
jgi:hypothetical protein